MSPEDTAAVPPQVAVYPGEREVDVVLRDGSTVHVRPVRADDRPAIRSFLEAISPESIGFRFFGPPGLDWVTAGRSTSTTPTALRWSPRRQPTAVVAHAAYMRERRRAEVAFLVADA